MLILLIAAMSTARIMVSSLPCGFHFKDYTKLGLVSVQLGMNGKKILMLCLTKKAMNKKVK